MAKDLFCLTDEGRGAVTSYLPRGRLGAHRIDGRRITFRDHPMITASIACGRHRDDSASLIPNAGQAFRTVTLKSVLGSRIGGRREEKAEGRAVALVVGRP